MNIKRVKKLAALGLAAVMLLGYGNARAMADDRTSYRGTFCGTEVSVSVAYIDDPCGDPRTPISVNAVTTFSRGGVGIYATAAIFYERGVAKYKTTSAEESASAGGAGAVACVPMSSATVVGGKGWHRVSCNGQTWKTELEMGVTSDDYREFPGDNNWSE